MCAYDLVGDAAPIGAASTSNEESIRILGVEFASVREVVERELRGVEGGSHADNAQGSRRGLSVQLNGE